MPDPDPRPSSSLRRNLILFGSVGVIVVGVAAALVVLFAGGKSSTGPGQVPTGSGPTTAPPVGNFSFTVGQVHAVTTGTTAGSQAAAASAARRIERTMDALYFAGYLDPSAWQSGSYDRAWALFVKEAQAGARKDESALTLGPGAGSKYSSVTAGHSTADVRVLMDPSGHPATAVVTVRFAAKAAGSDGTTSTITSDGAYYLVPSPTGWFITGYSVKRGAK